MATFTRPAQLQARMKQRAAAATYGMGQAHKDLYTGGRKDHAQYTSGRVSTRELRDMGHPFGRKRSQDRSTGARGVQNGATQKDLSKHARSKGNRIRKGVLMSLPINDQTGGMRRSFFQSAEQGADRTVQMGFSADYARWVLSPTGTRKMVARGFYSVGESHAAMGIIAKRHKARKAGIQAAVRRKILFLP